MVPTLSLSPFKFSGPVREAGCYEKRAYGRVDRHVRACVNLGQAETSRRLLDDDEHNNNGRARKIALRASLNFGDPAP